MKKIIFTFIIITTFLCSCGSLTSVTSVTSTSKRWVEYEILPSNITYNGESFFRRELSDGSTLTVLSDSKVSENSSYFYTLLWQDLGWYNKDGEWNASTGKLRPKSSRLYVNPKRRVAVYLDHNKNHSSYKVNIIR